MPGKKQERSKAGQDQDDREDGNCAEKDGTSRYYSIAGMVDSRRLKKPKAGKPEQDECGYVNGKHVDNHE
jgi:hypothetical protein